MKTVIDETIKTRLKITNILVVFEGTDHFQILCQLILMPKNDIKICRFANGKSIQEGAKNVLKNNDFLCFGAEMNRKTDVTLCPTTRYHS